MNNKKSTKRALITSMLSLVLCMSMLIGTTFAWFTDSVTSGSNVIQSGNLDLIVEYTLDGETWNDLDGATDLFGKGLWEPGHTEVVVFRIKNNGSLALQYTASMNIFDEKSGTNVAGEEFWLSDVLTVSTLTIQADTKEENTFVDWVASSSLEMAFSSDDNSLAYGEPVSFYSGNVLQADHELFAGDSHYVFVKVDMPETVGNEANHNGDVPSINFGVNVLATQYTYEEDSFGNDYDEDADYFVAATTTEEMAAILANGGTIEIVEPLTLDGGLAVNADVNVTGGEIENPTTSYAFSANDGKLTIDNLTYEGAAGLRTNGGELEINGGTYHIAGNNSSSRHTIYVAEGKVVINDGTFTRSNNATDGYKRGATIYASAGTEVVINGGSFAKGHSRTGNIVGDGTVTIYGGTFEFNPTKWLADGYTATQGTDGWWTVSAAN